MSRALITIRSQADRSRALNWVSKAPFGTRVEFRSARRTLDQNARMWAMLSDIASQKTHHGRRYTTDTWKVLFLHACGHAAEFIPSLDGAETVPWGRSSSNLSKGEMSDLIEFMFQWGAENDVVWSDPTIQEAA